MKKAPPRLAERALYILFVFGYVFFLVEDYLHKYNAPCPPVAIQQQQQHIMLFIAWVILVVVFIRMLNYGIITQLSIISSVKSNNVGCKRLIVSVKSF